MAPTEPIGACRFHGKQMPFDCTQWPTNAAIATRPCLISAWRNQPMVSFDDSAMFSGSQKPTTGFSFLASASRPALSDTSLEVHGLASIENSSAKFIETAARVFTGAGTYETGERAASICERATKGDESPC